MTIDEEWLAIIEAVEVGVLDDAARDKVLNSKTSSRVMALRFAQGGMEHEFEDLRAVAFLSLCEAAAMDEPWRETAFWTYARHRVRGDLLDYIRESRRIHGCRRKRAHYVSFDENLHSATELPTDPCELQLEAGRAWEHLRNLGGDVLMQLVAVEEWTFREILAERPAVVRDTDAGRALSATLGEVLTARLEEDPPVECGEGSSYRKGCRCGACREKHNARQRRWKRRRRFEKVIELLSERTRVGLAGGDVEPLKAPPAKSACGSSYRSGCRCAACKAKHAAKHRAYRRQRKARAAA